MITIKSILEQLDELLESADSSMSIDEESLDEKIMSKKKARKLKKQAELLAKKQAKEQAKLDKQEAPTDDNGSDGGDNDSNENDDNTEEQGTALVVYEPQQEDDATEVSEDFRKFMEQLNNLSERHQQDISKANDMWKSAGEDSECPQQAWDLYNNSINEFRGGVEQAVNEFVQSEKATAPELQIAQQVITALNGYCEKAGQEIMAAKPNLVETDFKAPATTGSTDMVATDDGNTNTTGTALVPVGSTALTVTGDAEEVEPEEEKDSKKRRNIVTYKKFMKAWNPVDGSFLELRKGIGKLLTAPLSVLKDAALNLGSWLSDKVFGFLTSPLATDLVKALAYSNPITAMIFDGKVVNFGIKDGIGKLKDKANKALQQYKSKDPVETNPNDYNSRKLLKRVPDLTLKRLKAEYYGNKYMVELINVAFNHADVKEEDKAKLLAYTLGTKKNFKDTKITDIPDEGIRAKEKGKKEDDTNKKGKSDLAGSKGIVVAFKNKDVKSARKYLQAIIDTCNDICDYMDWDTPSKWEQFVKPWMLGKDKGNTNAEMNKIEKKAKSKKVSDKQDNSFNELKSIIKALDNGKMDKNDMIKAVNKKFTDTYTDEQIADAFKAVQSELGESYNRYTRLTQLLEEALK